MRSLGPGSLAAVLKLGIDVLYFLSFVPPVLLAVLCVLIPFFSDSTHLTVHPHVLVQFDPDTFEVLPGQHSAPKVTVERAVAELEVEGVSPWRMLIGLSFAWVFWLVLFVGLRKLRAIFRTLKEGDPFVAENAARIRFLGFAVIAFELLYRGAEFWMYFAFVMNQFGIAGLELRPLFDLNFAVLFAGLVLLVLAEVFRVGTELRREQELTV